MAGLDSIGAPGGPGQPQETRKSGGGFLERMKQRFDATSQYSPEQKAQMGNNIRNAFKGDFREPVDNSSVSFWNQPRQ